MSAVALAPTQTLTAGVDDVTAIKDEDADLPLGSYREQAILLTNHPQRPRIALYFETEVQTDAGRQDGIFRAVAVAVPASGTLTLAGVMIRRG